MPELVSAPKKAGWSCTIKCCVCKHTYKYRANEVVLGEDSSDPNQGVVYCGNCNTENLTPPLPAKVLRNAKRY